MRMTTVHRMLFVLGAGALLIGVGAVTPVASASPQGSWAPGNYITINDPVAAPHTTIAGEINDLGVVGGTYVDATTPGQYHGFVEWNGKYTTIDDPLAGTAGNGEGTQVDSMNDLGELGGYYTMTNGHTYGFVDIGGHFTTISDPLANDAPGYGTIVNGVSNLGVIVGVYWDSEGTWHGFTEFGGHYKTLDCAGAGTGYGYGTWLPEESFFGAIPGTCYEQNGFYNFIYSAGKFTQVPNVSGSSFTEIVDTNDTGTSVGVYYETSTSPLGSYVDSHGTFTTVPPPSGMSGIAFLGVNEFGGIAGYSFDASGNDYSFVLFPAR
jgi:hypothetical protein